MPHLFPEAPQAWQDLVRPICEGVRLPHLTQHLHVLLLSAVFYHAIYLVSASVSPRISASYRKLGERTKVNWDIHSVSMIQSLIILYLIWDVHKNDPDRQIDKIHGFSAYAGDVYATACGYFLWDLVISSYFVRWYGSGFVFHGAASLQIFLFSYAPFLQHYGPAFLVFEASTPFLNIHWYLDKVDMTGGLLQLINGAALLATFFSVRIVWGWYMSYQLFSNIWRHFDFVNVYISAIYLFSNLSLNCLNIYWYVKMIEALRKRLAPSKAVKTETKKVR